MSDLLTIKQLSHEYGEHAVLDKVDLSLKDAEFLAILGPSGCGKSTLLRAIAGLVETHAGQIQLQHTIFNDNGNIIIPAEKRRVGFVFQDYALFPFLTVRENIAFGLKTKNGTLSKTEINSRTEELLALIGMQAFASRLPSQLSGGQQQRVAIARALAPRPKLLLLDEPFANVDSGHRQVLAEELQILTRHEKVGVILVTHDRHEAFALADRVAILQSNHQGASILQCDSPEKVYQQPKNKVVAAMTGPVSFVPAQANGNLAQTDFALIPLVNPSTAQGTVIIRPEMVSFVENPQGTFEIASKEFYGYCYRCKCQSRDTNISVLCQTQKAPKIGARGDLVIEQACWFV